MNKKILVISLALILLMSCLISARETSLLVRTGKQCRVSINVLRAASEYELIEAIHQDTNSDGDVSTTISSGYAEVNILIIMKKNGIKFFEEEFGPYSINEPIVIDLRSEEEKNPPVENITIVEDNATLIEESITENSEISENKTSTGFAIKNLGEVMNKYQIFFFSFIVMVFVFGIFLFFKKFRKKKEKIINVKKLSDFMNEQSQTETSSSDLREAKRKLEEVQREIRKIENKERIIEARKKLEETQREIERLERGE